MMTEEEFLAWISIAPLSDEAVQQIRRIRESAPSRRVEGHKSNVSGSYPSKKMGQTIQYESHKVELLFIQLCEHSNDILEYYDQPPPVKLFYPLHNGRATAAMKTFDFFVLKRDGTAGWVECKSEDELLRLSEEKGRYQKAPDGTWIFPPGEEYAFPLGLTVTVWSSEQANHVLHQNYIYLEDYFRDETAVIEPIRAMGIVSVVSACQGIRLSQLYDMSELCTRDEVLMLISRQGIFVDITAHLLSQPEKVPVFSNESMAAGFNSKIAHQSPLPVPIQQLAVETGARFGWAGQEYVILNAVDNKIFIQGHDENVITMGLDSFDRLTQEGSIRGVSSNKTPTNMLAEAIKNTSPEQMARANARNERISAILSGQDINMNRTDYEWLKKFREAESSTGIGYLGLIDNIGKRGNRQPRMAAEVYVLIHKIIEDHYLTTRQPGKKSTYRIFRESCLKNGLTPASYKTFTKYISALNPTTVTIRRKGRRAAYQNSPPITETTKTTSRHGERPWEIAHIDHTELDIELVNSISRKALGRPWLTLMIDARNRRVLAYYLTFEPPSYRSCLMVIREAVRRYNRLPQHIVVDNGKEFKSIYFSSFLALYQITRKDRPPAQARFGSLIERMFGTINTQLLYNLRGNTQIMRDVRQVTKTVNPQNTAVWTLAELSEILEEYLYEVYDSTTHVTLGESPRDSYTREMKLHGDRPLRIIPYNQDFIISTLPTTPKGKVKVTPFKGVKVNSIWYWNEEFNYPGVARTCIDIRFDPFDIGCVYGLVRGRWVKCLSRYFAQLEGLTQYELKAIREEIKMRGTIYHRNESDTDQAIAQFLMKALNKEESLVAQRRAAEAKTLRKHLKIVPDKVVPKPSPNQAAAPLTTEIYDELN